MTHQIDQKPDADSNITEGIAVPPEAEKPASKKIYFKVNPADIIEGIPRVRSGIMLCYLIQWYMRSASMVLTIGSPESPRL